MSHINEKNALRYHCKSRPGKTEIIPTKPAYSSEDIALAYSPGAQFASKAINSNKWNAYRYTNKGNLIGIISDGANSTALKPLMESKSMLMKRLADIDSFDIETSEDNCDKLIKIIQSIATTFGGISIGGIKEPESILLQERLQQLIGIPVLHDEAYGAAILIAAILNRYFMNKQQNSKQSRILIVGNDATARATQQVLRTENYITENIITLDNEENQLSKITSNCKVIISTDKEVTLSPHIFSGAQPDAIIILLDANSNYNEIKRILPRATVATGNINMPNFIDSILVSPYIFRGALDTLSTSINTAMLQAAIKSFTLLIKDDEADFMPHWNDITLAEKISSAVALAAMESGIARRKINDWNEYKNIFLSRLERIYNMTQHIRYNGKQAPRLHQRYRRTTPEY